MRLRGKRQRAKYRSAVFTRITDGAAAVFTRVDGRASRPRGLDAAAVERLQAHVSACMQMPAAVRPLFNAPQVPREPIDDVHVDVASVLRMAYPLARDLVKSRRRKNKLETT